MDIITRGLCGLTVVLSLPSVAIEGRVRAIADIETEVIAPCHREFLRNLQVRANLVVPILTAKGLWGLLVAHHGSIRSWSHYDIEQVKSGAETLAAAPSIRES